MRIMVKEGVGRGRPVQLWSGIHNPQGEERIGHGFDQ